MTTLTKINTAHEFVDQPMPGDKLGSTTVVASCHTSDSSFLVLLLETEAPYFTVACVHWVVGDQWAVDEAYSHRNIVHAINGDDFPIHDPDEPHRMIGPRRLGYTDLGGDV